MIKEIGEGIDRISGMVAGGIGWAVIGIGGALVFLWDTTLKNHLGSLGILMAVLILCGAGSTVLLLTMLVPMLVVAVGAVGGLFYGMYYGYSAGLSGLMAGRDPWQERQQEDNFGGPVSGEAIFFSRSQSEETYSALVQKVRTSRVSKRAKQYSRGVITQEELAEFKSIMEAKPVVEERDQELYERLAATCQITYNPLLKKSDPPITVKSETERGVFFRTYNYSAFLQYLMDEKGRGDIKDPFMQVSLASAQVTFFIGFPDVNQEDFDYIREAIGKKRPITPSTERAAESRLSRRVVSDAQAALFHHPLASSSPGEPGSRLFTFSPGD